MTSSYMFLSISAVWVTLTVLTFMTVWRIGAQQTLAELLRATELRS